MKYLFVVIYLIIDIIYISISAPFYSKVVEKIQGKPILLTPASYVSLLIAYLILGFGWLFIVADRLNANSTYRDAILYSFMYAISVYGVFNATLYVLFDNWDIMTVIRDTSWGLVCIISLTLVYFIVAYKKPRLLQ